MKRVGLFTAIAIVAVVALGQTSSSGPYRVLKTIRAGGDGSFEDLYADVVGRRLYIPRSGPSARITVFDLDTLGQVGEVASARANDATVDPKSGHGFASNRIHAALALRSSENPKVTVF